MSHLVVTRFAVPRPEADTRGLYRDPAWLEERFRLFERFFVPSVGALGVPAVLLCGGEVVSAVRERTRHLAWVRVEAQDEWHGGWRGAPGDVLTRLDSDDAVHSGWLAAVDRAPAEARVLVTREHLRWDLEADRLHRYRRNEPSPLAAFRGGANPYAVDHKTLGGAAGVHVVPGCFLLQTAHGGNVKNARPKPWRLDRRVPRRVLEPYGVLR